MFLFCIGHVILDRIIYVLRVDEQCICEPKLSCFITYLLAGRFFSPLLLLPNVHLLCVQCEFCCVYNLHIII